MEIIPREHTPRCPTCLGAGQVGWTGGLRGDLLMRRPFQFDQTGRSKSRPTGYPPWRCHWISRSVMSDRAGTTRFDHRPGTSARDAQSGGSARCSPVDGRYTGGLRVFAGCG